METQGHYILPKVTEHKMGDPGSKARWNCSSPGASPSRVPLCKSLSCPLSHL